MPAQSPNELRSWIRSASYAADEARYMGRRELISYHTELHQRFGDVPNDAIIDIEQQISNEMRSMGLEHRYDDELSKVAGTYVENQVPVTMDEVSAYLATIGLDTDAISLVRDTTGGPVYVDVSSSLLKGMEKQIIRAMNRTMPPGVILKPITKGLSGDFAERQTAYDLKLDEGRALYAMPSITLWESVTARLRGSAAAASSVFKVSQDPIVPFKTLVFKESVGSEEEDTEDTVLVTGVVLEPEVVDGTVSKADQTVGDIYSEEEIFKGMSWWMENARHSFSYMHIKKGGYEMDDDEVILVECWQTRVDQKIGTQDIIKGSWVMTTLVKDVKLVDDIRQGRMNSWSVGMNCMGGTERVAA